MSKTPRIEKLALTYYQGVFDDHGLPRWASEEIVRLCLHPLPIDPIIQHGVGKKGSEGDAVWTASAALARTATGYVLPLSDYARVMDALQAEYPVEERDDRIETRTGLYGEYDRDAAYEAALHEHPYDFIDLPPLPYPRMALELFDDESGGCASFYGTGRDGGRHALHPILLINETVPGEWWDCYFPSYETDGRFPELFDFRIGAQGRFWMPTSDMKPDRGDLEPLGFDVTEENRPTVARFWRRLVLDAISLVTAHNVPREPIHVPRQHRRRFERTHGFPFPSPYFVRLDQAGDTDAEGASDREYHVRWLVRGHWRHLDSGVRLCSACGYPATWVPPHVKGEIGKPWKGRPIYSGAHGCSRTRKAVTR